MKWLHISDIHCNMKRYDAKSIRSRLTETFSDLNLQLDFILISGDCIYKYGGNTKEQHEVADYIKDITKAGGCTGKQVHICAGNHDVNREDESSEYFAPSAASVLFIDPPVHRIAPLCENPFVK